MGAGGGGLKMSISAAAAATDADADDGDDDDDEAVKSQMLLLSLVTELLDLGGESCSCSSHSWFCLDFGARCEVL